ncbi:MAG: hypothetical protein RLZZ476_1223 [Verrucomicrobiota bacterium]
MRDVVEKAGLSARIEIDSAGTEGWHSGKLPDQRMRQAASTRGITLDHRARQFKAVDLERFDLILAMDRDNERNIRALDRENRHAAKIRLFCDFCTDHSEREVPDPYYGGPEGFEHVLDLIEDGCEGLLREVKSRL